MSRIAILAMLVVIPGLAFGECPEYSTAPRNLVELEPQATRGALTQDQKDCLEKNYADAEKQTTKDKISRVLMVNAYAYNTAYWADLVQRHLDEVDRSDPNIAYLYAFYLYNNEKADPEDVIKWTETGLDRRDIWEGNTFVTRVYGLMRLRAWAASGIWERAEEGRAAAGGVGDDEQIELLRTRAKTFAREWVDFARAAGRSAEESAALCMSVARDAGACGLPEGPEEPEPPAPQE